MNRRPISIQDIAHEAGVSHSTVSRALHDSPLISPGVRRRVQLLAEEMGYTPNAVAQSLKGSRTNTVGLIVTSIADPFVARVVRGVENIAQTAGISVFLSVSNNDPEREMELVEAFYRRRVDGVISATAQIWGPYSERLAHIEIPTVLVNQFSDVERAQLRWVHVDDYSGACQAVQHLLELGHRRIGYIGVGNRPHSNQRRLAGYRDSLQQAGIPFNDALVHIAPADHRLHSDDVTDGQTLSATLLQAGVTAIFCYNDLVAVGALLTCRSLGLAVPRQLSIVGFDDIELTQYVTPSLSTVHQPKLRLGETAMSILLDLLEGKSPENQLLPVDLVVRDTTAPPFNLTDLSVIVHRPRALAG